MLADQETRKEGRNVRRDSFKNNHPQAKLHPSGISKYQEKMADGFCAWFFFGSAVSSLVLTSKHKAQEGSKILQMGQCLAAPRSSVRKPKTWKQTQESIRSG